MAKYRKKPVVIEAIQYKLENWIDICRFIPIPDILYIPESERNKDKPILRIRTLEGEHLVSYGDYIVKGVKGEYYAVKPDIFEKTYEEVSNE